MTIHSRGFSRAFARVACHGRAISATRDQHNMSDVEAKERDVTAAGKEISCADSRGDDRILSC